MIRTTMLLFNLVALLCAGLCLCVYPITTLAQSTSTSTPTPSILLFTRTVGYRHDAIPYAIRVITALGQGPSGPNAASLYPSSDNIDDSIASIRWNTINSEDATIFENATYLSQFTTIVFAFTTDVDPPGVGTLLSDDGVDNFMSYIQNGGNFVGIHSATNTLYPFPAYGRLAGAFFTYHAGAQPVTLKAVTNSHPSTSKWPSTLKITEEMYHLRTDPRNLPSKATVLVSNATAYPDPGGTHNEGTPQPLAWYRQGNLLNSAPSGSTLGGDLDGMSNYSGGDGKSFITTLGHQNSTWNNPTMRGHVLGGIAWTLQNSTSGSSDSSTTSTSSPSASASSGNTSGGTTSLRYHSISISISVTAFLAISIFLAVSTIS